MDKMQTMGNEFIAATNLSRAMNALNQTPVVDDDYPEVRERYEGALIGLLRAMKDNSRFHPANNHYGVTVTHDSSRSETPGLSLGALRKANTDRQALWCEDPTRQPDLSFRGNELAGETGEACNVIKKLERERQGWRGERDTVEHLAEELADVIICVDLIALGAGINLSKAVREKFNATSRKVGLPTMLGE